MKSGINAREQNLHRKPLSKHFHPMSRMETKQANFCQAKPSFSRKLRSHALRSIEDFGQLHTYQVLVSSNTRYDQMRRKSLTIAEIFRTCGENKPRLMVLLPLGTSRRDINHTFLDIKGKRVTEQTIGHRRSR